ncbi:hypothetical protein EEL30_19865 [Brevibacillus laterosporus]|uniref:Uncharacterized protein n=1 Tax=Brevibacillus laterosporus TaxID=1465 RepID=A0A518VBJ3_BRELA|nr:hypothetical protein EEL30_19865 [Brevibacillus laterosporus]
MSVSKQLERLVIPSGLTEEREKKLKKIKEDLRLHYSLKSIAMWNIKNYAINQNEKDLQDFMTSSSLAQDSITRVNIELPMLEKEMGIVKVDE